MSIFDRAKFSEEDEGVGVFISSLSSALTTWVCMNAEARDNISVADAAMAFNTPPEVIREAVEDGRWLFLATPESEMDPTKQFIEVDGE